MVNKNKILSSLPVNKNVIFNSPIENKNIYLTRTGVFKDNDNSFTECILTSYFPEYSNETYENKGNFFMDLKKKLSTKSEWINDKKYYKYFYNNIQECFELLYKYITDVSENKLESLKIINNKIYLKIIKNKISKKLPLFEILTEIFPINDIKDVILVDFENSPNSILDFKNTIKNNLAKYISSLEILSEIEKKRCGIIKENITDLFETILSDVEENVFKFYLSKIPVMECNKKNILNICEKLKINIYFIDSDTRLPFVNEDNIQTYENPLSIIILKIQNNFEIIGKLESKNKIKKIFSKDEILIKRIDAFLFDKKIVEAEYPELLKHMKDDLFEKKIPVTPNNSEEDETSTEDKNETDEEDKNETENKEQKTDLF